MGRIDWAAALAEAEKLELPLEFEKPAKVKTPRITALVTEHGEILRVGGNLDPEKATLAVSRLCECGDIACMHDAEDHDNDGEYTNTGPWVCGNCYSQPDRLCTLCYEDVWDEEINYIAMKMGREEYLTSCIDCSPFLKE